MALGIIALQVVGTLRTGWWWNNGLLGYLLAVIYFSLVAPCLVLLLYVLFRRQPPRMFRWLLEERTRQRDEDR